MNVKSIFVTLIVVVCCVIVGAFVINILLPNVTTTLINAVEEQIYNATGMAFDFNNDSTKGGDSNNEFAGDRDGSTDAVGAENAVQGFQ